MLLATLSTLLVASSVALASPLIRRDSVISNCYHDMGFTFDDGPWHYHDVLNNVFASANSHTTFFMNGLNWGCIYDEVNVQAIRNSYEEGMLLAHHTWSHLDLQTLSSDEIDEQINRLNDAFVRILGVKPKILRPPYGSINDTLAEYLQTKHGFSALVTWSADTKDWVGDITDPQHFYDFYKDIADTWNVTGPQMPLSHEVWPWTVEAFEEGIVEYYRSKNINPITVAQCLDLEPYEIVTGYFGERDESWTCNGTYVPMPDPTSTTSASASSTSTSTISTSISVSSVTTTVTSATTTLTSSTTTSSPTCVQTYTSVSGDDCQSIGTKFGLSASAILAANTFLNCLDVWPWTPICIPPGGSPSTTCTQTYYSQANDTCNSIGQKYGVSGAQILAWNSFLTCDDIWVNTPVCV